MSLKKRSRTQSSVTDGTRRFATGDEDLTIAEVRKLESPVIAGMMNYVIPPGGREHTDHEEAEQRTPFCSAAIQDSRMTFALFVETKFIPEHVQYKTSAGRTHYQAILKHVITPHTVSRIFNPEKIATARLKDVPGWPYLDALRLCDLRPEHVRRVVSAADSAGYSAQTVRHIKNVCFAIVAHAQKEGCFGGPNPAGMVKLPRLVRNASPGLTLKETNAILDLLQHPYREIALFALTAGMTLPEICDVRWKDLNIDDCERIADGHIVPARTVVVKNWWNPGGVGDTRAFRKNKYVEIREPLLSSLRELRKGNPAIDGEDLVLISGSGEQIIPASFRAGELKRVGRALGMPWLSWQDLRRTHPAFVAQPFSACLPSKYLSAETMHAGRPGAQALSREAAFWSNRLRIDSHRTCCFGRRMRVLLRKQVLVR